MKEGKLRAVHDDDISTLLESLGCLDKVIAGESKCFFCKETVSIEDIIAVFPKDNEICFCCDNVDCYYELMKMTNKEIV